VSRDSKGPEPIRAGLVGCGRRGTGAAENFLMAAPGLRLVALADAFPDRLAECRTYLAGLKHEGYAVEEERCFAGYDAYRRLLDCGVDLVLLCAPPGFRPLHFAAAVTAGKHVFFEKPVAVDPAGVRKILAAGEEAGRKGLGVVAGTLYRHHRKFRETIRRVHEGAIGKVLSARAWYNTGALWRYDRKPGERELDYQVRNWPYFDWLSGDILVEQHVHTLDVVAWTLRAKPARAIGTGGRQARTGPEHGNVYDHFAVDYAFEGGVHCLSMNRQIAGAFGEVGAWFYGSEGVASPYAGTIAGANPWTFQGEAPDAYVQEQTDLIESIRSGSPLNETKQIAESTLLAILGREAAYTGKALTWDEILASSLDLTPSGFDWANPGIAYEPPVRVVPMPGRPRA
jgi:predicted dehydrogenase